MMRTGVSFATAEAAKLLTHEEQSECGASVTSGLEENLGQGLTSDRTGNGRDITQGEHDDNQEGETEGGTACQSLCYLIHKKGLLEHDSVYPADQCCTMEMSETSSHSSGNAHLWPDGLFGHGRKHTSSGEAVSTLDQSENPALHCQQPLM